MALGLLSGKSYVPILTLPIAGVISFLSFVPLIVHRETVKRTLSGEYFDDKTKDQIMDIARDYVDGYNDYYEAFIASNSDPFQYGLLDDFFY